jgi:type IV pilus assembly protein PilC
MSDLPVAATPAEMARPVDVVSGKRRPLSPADLSLFAELLSNLLRVNLPLPEALRTLGKEAQTKALRRALTEVTSEVAAGTSFAEALRRRRGVFPELFVRVVEQGQAANDLTAALVEMVREYRSRARFREALLSQLAGPIITVFAFLCLVLSTMVFILPKFRDVFVVMGASLPVLTRLLLFGNLIVAYWEQITIVVILMAAVAVLMKTKVIKLPFLERMAERCLLSIPYIGSYLRARFLGRFCRLLGLLLQRGMPLDMGLGLVRDSFTFLPMRDAVAAAAERVAKGSPVDAAMGGSRMFPETLLLFVRGGQKAGNLGEALERAADMYEERAENLGAQLRFQIFVACALLVGLAVAVFVIGMFLPIFKMQEMMRKH